MTLINICSLITYNSIGSLWSRRLTGTAEVAEPSNSRSYFKEADMSPSQENSYFDIGRLDKGTITER